MGHVCSMMISDRALTFSSPKEHERPDLKSTMLIEVLIHSAKELPPAHRFPTTVRRRHMSGVFLLTASFTFPGALPSSSGCRLIPHQAESFNQIKLGDEMTHTIAPQESWNIWFNHHEPSFVRFNVTTQQGCKLALFAGKNNPPTLTVNAFRETISSEAPQVAEFHMSTKSRRAVGMTVSVLDSYYIVQRVVVCRCELCRFSLISAG